MEDLNDKVNNGGASAAGKLANTEWNQIASEAQAVIEAAGITLSSATLTQLLVAITQMASGKGFWCTDSGSSTAYVLTPAYTVANVLFTGLTLKFRPATNNSIVAPTVNYNGTGVKTIKNEAGDGLVVGDLSTLRDAEIRYDGTDFRLLTRSTNLLLASAYKRGYIRGFTMLNGITNPNPGVYVTAGECANADASLNLVVATALEKRIDQNWVAGTNAGGKPSALTIANNTWYRVFVIGGPSAATDVGFDTSATAANLLSTAGVTYTKYRQIGWVMTDGSANIRKFVSPGATPDIIYWQTPYLDHDAQDITTSRQLQVLTAPPSSVAIAVATMKLVSDSQAYYLDLRHPDMDDVAASSTNYVLKADVEGSVGFKIASNVDLWINSASEIAFRGATSGGSALGNIKFGILTRGFKYARGINE